MIKDHFKLFLILILLFTSLTRLFHLDYPKGYVFDEVYHAFTAKEYLLGHKEAWEWWTQPPPNVAYEWTHPPLAKEIMAVSMFVLKTTDAYAYRLPGALLGILGAYLVFLLGKQIFEDTQLALVGTFIFSIDGLNFVQSRVGMNDIYFVTSMLACLLFFLKKRFLISSIFLGLTLVSKWTGIYLVGILFILSFSNFSFLRSPKTFFQEKAYFLYFLIIPPIIYLISYIPFFLLGHSPDQFIQLQQQMWWYHTGLKATHDYASPWWSWPLNLYPVWYFVDYHKNETISNIFASGNPFLFWVGTGAILVTLWDFIQKRNYKLFIILLGFFSFWLPWVLSPRIMFLYHFSPSVPFLSLALAYQITTLKGEKNYKIILITILFFLLLGFLLVYPMLVGIPLPKDYMQLFFRTNLTKNPFG